MHFQTVVISGLFFVAALSVLTGCQSIQEAMAKQQEEIAQQDDAYCRSIGLNFGTDQYAQCRMLKTQLRQQAQAQVAANSTAMLATAGTLMAPQPAPAVQPLPNILPQQTRCQSYGATTNCTTY
ncbi:hypothetical protein [Bradyrhizobium erythrophlei]|uniref:Uncharacterized protein n=1 Tax=Bradyrhizobium erythrophlei TaxID=1437360 RepID=A0A1M7T757_9BRAD|nr:hypothetical protein [Bradyrhizobium erythrophlei]SHN66563.1 hypothetical protein SAMN05444170_0989 [Bradyrhizobium erythrophlei]